MKQHSYIVKSGLKQSSSSLLSQSMRPGHKHTLSSVNSMDSSQSVMKVGRLSRSSVGTRMYTGLSAKPQQPTQGSQQAPVFISQDVGKSDNFDDILKTRYDEDMQRYRYKSRNPAIMRLERVQSFIFAKKSHNKLKYSANSRINVTALPVPRGTVSVMLNIQRKDYGFQLGSFKKKIPLKSKFKMKWKTIQWLLNNRQDAIQQIFNNYTMMLKFAQKRKGGMSREDFGELLSYVGLGADPNLADKLFYIFDEDCSGSVDYKELIIGLEIFKSSSIEEKLKVFFDLCDTDRNGNITKEEVYNILKQNFIVSDDKAKLKKIIQRLFDECDLNGDGVLDREELLIAARSNDSLRSLLEESIRNVQSIDQMIENDLQEPFNCYVPMSANFVNYKEGIYFPQMDKVMKALAEVELVPDFNHSQSYTMQTTNDRYLTRRCLEIQMIQLFCEYFMQKRPEEDLDPSNRRKQDLDPQGNPLKLKKRVANAYLVYNYGLGKGSFGTTALAARCDELNQYLACKIIDKRQILKKEELINTFQERLQAEIDTWKKMDHPNIVKFVDFRESANSLYMFMEYCVGTLERTLRPPVMKIPETEAMLIFKQIANGCQYLYEQNVVHRDLKPTNILVSQEGTFKIADFGFAKFMDEEIKNTQVDQTGQIGTVVYMSPQVYERKPYSIKTDVWSLGIIFYEVLVGRTPDCFLYNLHGQGIQFVDSETLVYPPNVKISDKMKQLIRSMLVRDEAHRISITELVQQLN